LSRVKFQNQASGLANSLESLERRRLPRLFLSSEQFWYAQTRQLYAMSDISQEGFGFWLREPEDGVAFVVGFELDGMINLMRRKYPVKAQVCNVLPYHVGCKLVSPAENLVQGIADALSPARLGQELKAIPEPGALWYHGPMGTDLFFHQTKDGKYKDFIFYILQYFVQWEDEKGLITGGTHYASQGRCGPVNEGIFQKHTLELEPDAQPDSQKLAIAKTLILSSKLPSELRNWCVKSLDLSN